MLFLTARFLAADSTVAATAGVTLCCPSVRIFNVYVSQQHEQRQNILLSFTIHTLGFTVNGFLLFELFLT